MTEIKRKFKMLINKSIVCELLLRAIKETALVPSLSPPLHLIISDVTDVPCPAHLGNNA